MLSIQPGVFCLEANLTQNALKIPPVCIQKEASTNTDGVWEQEKQIHKSGLKCSSNSEVSTMTESSRASLRTQGANTEPEQWMMHFRRQVEVKMDLMKQTMLKLEQQVVCGEMSLV